MTLPSGTWKANINGVELDLRLDPPNQAGAITGQLLNTDFRGFWDENTQILKFQLLVIQDAGSLVVATFTGHLFRTPTNPEPGRDVLSTVVGQFQMTPSLSPNLPFPATVTGKKGSG